MSGGFTLGDQVSQTLIPVKNLGTFTSITPNPCLSAQDM